MSSFFVKCEKFHVAGEYSVIEADDHKSAAERFGEDYNEDGDYTLSKGGRVRVEVRSVDGSVKSFEVTAETVPVYFAEEVKP